MPPQARYKSTADFVTAEIRRLILSGELPAGARVDQEELAEQLEVSRHPVRQAIDRLGERGFVIIHPHRSAIVAEISIADMEELYGARRVLEDWAIREFWNRSAAVTEADLAPSFKISNWSIPRRISTPSWRPIGTSILRCTGAAATVTCCGRSPACSTFPSDISAPRFIRHRDRTPRSAIIAR